MTTRRVEEKMRKTILGRNLQTRNNLATASRKTLDPNELKNLVRDGLMALSMPEREEFIQTLGAEMKRVSLSIRAYLVPLGIPARSPEDLTPTEVGHLIRFLRINVPQATAAVERAMGRYSIFAEKASQTHDRMAA
jgi:hypothetical protein